MKYFYESIAELKSMSEVTGKLDQVERNNARLRMHVNEYLESNPVDIDHKDLDNGQFQFYVKAYRPFPDEIGDSLVASLQSARSLLNYCAFNLANNLDTSLSLPNNPKKVAFPICQTEKEYRDAVKDGYLGNPKDHVIEAVKRIQPFANIGSLFGGDSSEIAGRHFLSELQIASNYEKHYLNPKIILASGPRCWTDLNDNPRCAPFKLLKVSKGSDLHTFNGNLSVKTVQHEHSFFVEFTQENLTLPLIGWVESYTWFIKHVLIPTVFEPTADNAYITI